MTPISISSTPISIFCQWSNSSVIAFFAVAMLSCNPTFAQEKAGIDQDLPLDELQVFAEVFGKIKSEYVDEAGDVSLLRDAIKGMLNGLDPHSTFLEPEAFKEIRISTEGKFGGVGIEVTTNDGLITVVTPIDGTPAADADIQAGDLIVMIDGKPVGGMDLRDAVDSMRGEPGSRIVLTVTRESSPDPIDVPLVRAIIKVASVRSELLEPGYGYARIASFQNATASNLRDQIEKMTNSSDGRLKGLVLDMRNNPGGVLNGAVDVSDLFLDDGLIVSTRGRDSGSDSSYSARPGDLLDGAPLVVLVNGGSASASEIVAGALQDHERALIMGTKTFGKGSVQTVIPMNNGGALKLTTARYYTPHDRSIQAKGIEPDIKIEQTLFADKKKGRDTLTEADLDGHLESETEADGVDAATNENSAQAKPPKSSELLTRDYQIVEALNMLKGMHLVLSQLDAEG